jgi:sugar lactone lactonase YvrE
MPRIKTIAGVGRAGFGGDAGRALDAVIAEPFGVVVGPDEGVYFCDLGNHRIRRIDPMDGTIATVAGNGESGYGGDDGPAIEASLIQPYEIRFDAEGHLFFVDMKAHVVRRVDKDDGIVTTVAGSGEVGFTGDGGPAREAAMNQPHSIEFDREGLLYICDIQNHRIRRVDLSSGTISTFAGTGEQATTVDGSARTVASLNGPRALAFDDNGDMYLALREGNVVVRLAAESQRFTRIAGTGERGYDAAGGPALAAPLSGPKGIAIGEDRCVYLADTESHTIRRIDLAGGSIETVIGDGTAHDGPDGEPLSCGLARPHGICLDGAGRLYVGDSENHRVRVYS